MNGSQKYHVEQNNLDQAGTYYMTPFTRSFKKGKH